MKSTRKLLALLLAAAMILSLAACVKNNDNSTDTTIDPSATSAPDDSSNTAPDNTSNNTSPESTTLESTTRELSSEEILPEQAFEEINAAKTKIEAFDVTQSLRLAIHSSGTVFEYSGVGGGVSTSSTEMIIIIHDGKFLISESYAANEATGYFYYDGTTFYAMGADEGFEYEGFRSVLTAEQAFQILNLMFPVDLLFDAFDDLLEKLGDILEICTKTYNEDGTISYFKENTVQDEHGKTEGSITVTVNADGVIGSFTGYVEGMFTSGMVILSFAYTYGDPTPYLPIVAPNMEGIDFMEIGYEDWLEELSGINQSEE